LQVRPVTLSGVSTDITVTDTGELQLVLTATASEQSVQRTPPPVAPTAPTTTAASDHELMFHMDDHQPTKPSPPVTPRASKTYGTPTTTGMTPTPKTDISQQCMSNVMIC